MSALDDVKSPNGTFIVGICGGTGSGKTTIVNAVLEGLEQSGGGGGKGVVVLSHDDYYRNRTDLSLNERAALNYDHPDALETELMVQHLQAIKRGQTVHVPQYDFSTHLRSASTREIVGKDVGVLIVEGILIFASQALASEFDVRLFIDVPADVRFIRRLKRDIETRGRTADSVIDQYLTTVRPMHEQFVKPFASSADLIVPHGASNLYSGAVAMLQGKIAHVLAQVE
jgi:uridine kinase